MSAPLIKVLRTIRFDASDDTVFAHAAGPDEWAVSGAFAFADLAPEDISGKVRQAFANGFLSIESLGRSTFATVSEVQADERATLEQRLADLFVREYGAPDLQAALPAARDELDFVVELCRDVAINTVFTVRRTLDDDGCIREEFRKINPPTAEPRHTRIWEGVEDDG